MPALTVMYGLRIRTAVAANLMGIIATSIGVGCVTRPGRAPDMGLAMRLEIATTAGALTGSFLAGFTPARLVSGAFAVIVLATALYTAIKGRLVDRLSRGDTLTVTNWPAGLAASGLAGAISGLRTVAWFMTPPTLTLLLVGLVAAIRARLATDAPAAAALTTLPLHALEAADQLVTPLGLLTVGLVLLAITPMITVLFVAVAHGRGRRWGEAAVATCVLAILALSVALKPHG